MAEDGKKPDTAPEVEEVKKSAPAADANAASPDTPVKEDTFEIRINSYKIVSAAGIVAVHNEVAFYRNGEPMLAINGNAHNNQTGELNTFALAPGNTLRVSGATQTYGQGANPMELVGSVTLGSNLTREEFLEKVKTALAASQYINDNKIDYVVVGGPHYEGQNSNSVATTLITAMGYKYPQNEFSGLWAPGAKRNLLPDGWTHNLTNEELVAAGESIEPARVAQQVRDEKIPVNIPEPGESSFPNLHDPNKPKLVQVQTDAATPKIASGFKSSTDTGIKVDQDLTESFAVAANSSTPKVAPAPELSEIAIKQPAQNQESYAALGANRR